MATNLTPDYSPKTPPISTERYPGSLASGSRTQHRFCMLEPIADEANGLQCGVFFTGAYDTMNVFRAKLPTLATDQIFGMVYHNIQRVLTWNDTSKAFMYPRGEIVSGLNEGDAYGWSETVCNPGEAVYQRIAAGTAPLTRLGAFANAAGAGLMLIPGTRFISKNTVPGQCIVAIQDTF